MDLAGPLNRRPACPVSRIYSYDGENLVALYVKEKEEVGGGQGREEKSGKHQNRKCRDFVSPDRTQTRRDNTSLLGSIDENVSLLKRHDRIFF